jgi:small subunit ribosomal protein S17e
MQEEEREKRLDFVPDVSAVSLERIEIDPETSEMLKAIKFPEMDNIKIRER